MTTAKEALAARLKEMDPDWLQDSAADGQVESLIAALHDAGFVIAPREPTKAMLAAGQISYADSADGEEFNNTLSDYLAEGVYAAMIAAAPKG